MRTSLLALAAIGLVLTGCGGPVVAPPIARTAAEELVAATMELRRGNFTFTVTSQDERSTGVVDQASRSAALTTEKAAGGVHELRLVGTDRYERGPAAPRFLTSADLVQRRQVTSDASRWRRTSADASSVSLDPQTLDLTGATVLLTHVVTVARGHDGDYTGTIDVAAAGGGRSVLTPFDGGRHADALRSVPFEATVDNGRRLADLAIVVPALGAEAGYRIAVEITGYDTATPVPVPPATEIAA